MVRFDSSGAARFVLFLAIGITGAPGPARAQDFVDDTTNVPQGAPFNNSFTENVDFADVDLDGDLDAVFADGGDFGKDRNRIWINMGGDQGGTIGVFEDQTATRFPNVIDSSRDVDFVDFDLDGDADLFIANSSAIANQTSRILVNMGGAQGGNAGFFADETQARWIHLGENDGSTTFSSIAPSLVLPSGGFIDWSCDAAFADLDGDGAMDLIHSSYGSVSLGNIPTRLFLNDGTGKFEEFNPSGFQLNGTDLSDGDPGIWAEGVQEHDTSDSSGVNCDVSTTALSIEPGDIDGDLDVDFLLGEKWELPRQFQNRTQENGSLAFRDISHFSFGPNPWASGPGKYEQELGDLDEDGDLDVYALNWISFCDNVQLNDGTGDFTPSGVLPQSCPRDSEADFIDYDSDGDLDVFIAKLAGQDRMYENAGPGGGYALNPTSGVLPPDTSTSLGCDAADVDGDGDYDLIVANGQGERNALLRNVRQDPDVTGARLQHLEQAPDRAPSAEPTVVRVHVYDNAAWYLTWFNTTTLEYSVDGGAFTPVAMTYSGGQVFRGEIPGNLVGSICYRARSVDEYGNTGLSLTGCYTSSGGCTGDVATYCTAKVNSCGGTPAVGSTGVPSASASSGFLISSTGARANKVGLVLYGDSGRANFPFQGGLLCVAPPFKRSVAVGSAGGSGGANCDATFDIDWNAFASGNLGGNPAAFLQTVGQQVNLQWWGRDTVGNGSYLSDGLEYEVCR